MKKKEVNEDLRNIGFELEEFLLADIKDSDFSELLDFDAVFILGGSSKYLMNLYTETGFDKFLPTLFEANITYIGSSASGMILSPTLDTADWYLDEEEDGARGVNGVGLINFQIYPHYDEKNLSKILQKRNPDLEYLLLKDGEAVSIDGEVMKFYGEGITVIPSKNINLPQKGKIFLTSESITPNLRDSFETFIGKSSKDLNIAFIPDAMDPTSESDEQKSKWLQEDLDDLNHLECNVTLFRITGKSINEIRSLSDYDAIYLNGGLSAHLSNVMRESGLMEILPSLLDSGVLYIGSSGGSMVLSETQEVASWYPGEEEAGAEETKSLGYIDFQISPHYEDEMFEKVSNLRDKNLKHLLFKNGQGISIEGGVMRFWGGEVTFLVKNSEETDPKSTSQ